MMLLERIEIEGFKSIRELELELTALNILIGANGAGKSNFITMFQLLNEMLERRLQVYTGRIGAESLLYFGAKTTSEIRVELTFTTDEEAMFNGYEAIWEPSNDDTLIFTEENYWLHDRSQYARPLVQHLGSGHRETRLFDKSSEVPYRLIVDYVIDALESWKLYHFHDTSAEAGIKRMGDIDDNAMLRPDASNLAAFLYRLKEKETAFYDRIVKTVRLVAPFFDDFILRPSPLNPEKIRLEWRERNSDTYFNAHSLSDGTLRFICLATLLLQPELPSLILIDEPELGLHPYAITLLANLLQSAAEQTQVIVSTQSVPLINQFTPEDVIVVDRDAEQSTFKRLDSSLLETWLEEYGLGELWEKNIIGGRPQHPERA